MRLDFRHYTFNSIFRLDDYSENIVLIDNDLEENQLLRANQLIQHTNAVSYTHLTLPTTPYV